MANSGKKNGRKRGRRKFLKTMTLGAGTLALPIKSGVASSSFEKSPSERPAERERITYPRVFQGAQRKLIGFPLGGVGAGSVNLGGRGQLRDWWVFNRPDKGRSPEYAFPSIWVESGNRRPVVRVLEARIMPPYERNSSDLGSANVPGLPRLRTCKFTGEYPMARIDFEDPELPVQVMLEAFTPFIPLDPDDSGLPLAVLRYRVSNPSASSAKVAIAYTIENPIGQERNGGPGASPGQGRQNDYRKGEGVEGLLMRNSFLAPTDPQAGTLALTLVGVQGGQVTYLRGWPTARWWESALLFWDDFSKDGRLGPEVAAHTSIGSLCLYREIPAHGKAEYTFLLTWHFPNRTPKRCGWLAPKGHENDVIGNYYCTRFKDAWEVAQYASAHLPTLEARTRKFLSAIRNTTLPDAAKDAAMANLSTLVTPTCFRTSDGAFHGFEGCNDHAGCCFGSCTHVYAYEPTTAHVFPSFSRSFREQQFGFCTDAEGLMDFRELLPYGIEHLGVAAADGQMACIVKLYLDWRLSGDTDWLRRLWPTAKRALQFAWIKGGWDANRDGVMEGVQHNTYDVEFFGPNPFCGIWYLGALRAGEEMARAVGDTSAADEYRRLFRRGSEWIDANLFNGEFYIQKVTPIPKDQIAKGLQAGMAATDTEHPIFQVGDGCLTDQLMGQYFAQVAGLGLLVDRDHIHQALRAIYKYNYKRTLANHACVERVYALNDEAGLVICEYPHGPRPQTPFPYFAEVWSGVEYAAAALMIYMGMVSEGVEVVESVRRRFDGENRNPWNETECGYHYARPMAGWAPLLALSGFRYHASEKSLVAQPAIERANFSSFWSTGTAWGNFSQQHQGGRTKFTLAVTEGKLTFRTVKLRSAKAGKGAPASELGSRSPSYELRRSGEDVTFIFKPEVTLAANDQLVLTL
ncbi:MAG: non-lysosomal glucosylceramidase [Acidobacteria bacterium]|nr:non-lysosomal glucosylceramidase [Acidobacteriota bacterium]